MNRDKTPVFTGFLCPRSGTGYRICECVLDPMVYGPTEVSTMCVV